jgi:uncharacterized protein (DUF2252 family)
VPAALSRFVENLGSRAPKEASDWRVDDAVQRIAGTGSLGSLRIAALVSTPAGDVRLIEFKEARPSSVAPGVKSKDSSAERVVKAAHALSPHVPRHLTAIPDAIFGLPMIARQLCPQEDKLEVATLSDPEHLRPVVETVAYVVGVAHRRAATKAPSQPWSAKHQFQLVDQAVEIAGLIESIYLAYARLSQSER